MMILMIFSPGSICRFSGVFAALFSAFALFVPVAFAQQAPRVYVEYLSLARLSYNQEDVISGTFQLSNKGTANVEGVYYMVNLLGDKNDAGVPQIEYGSQKGETVFLRAGEKKKIDFTYAIPRGVAGDLTLEVQAMVEGGAQAGWDTENISVKGENTFLTIDDPVVTVRGHAYSGQEGPTFATEGEGVLSFSVKNNAIGKTVIPILEIYSNTATEGQPLVRRSLDTLTIAPNEYGNESFTLPVFDGKPGVYEGMLYAVSAIDASLISNQTKFRYIVGGPAAAIRSVTSDKSSIHKGDTINLNIALSGTPIDISDDGSDTPPDQKFDLTVVLSNDVGREIGMASQTVDVKDNQNLVVPIKAMDDGRAIVATVTVSQNATILAQRSISLTPEGGDETYVEASPWSAVLSSTAGAISIVLLLALLVVLVWFMRRMNSRTAPLVIFFIFFLNAPHITHAFTVTKDFWEPGIKGFARINPGLVYPADIFINSPSGPICTGATFSLEGRIAATHCGNQPQQVYVMGLFQGVSHSYQETIPPAGGHSHSVQDVRFNLQPYVAPTTPGTYRMEIGYASVRPYKGFGQGKYGYEDIVVQDCANTCSNGAANFPDCSICASGSVMQNGTCVPSCGNGTNNPPQCTTCPAGQSLIGGVCASACPNGTNNPPQCTTCPTGMHAQTSASGGMVCVSTFCANGTINPPLCNICPAGMTFSGGKCVAQGFSGSGFNGGNGGNGNGNGLGLPSIDLQIRATPSLVRSGATTKLNWSASGVSACTVTAPNGDSWRGLLSAIGGEVSKPITSQTTYTLLCLSPQGPQTKSATVNILPTWNEQ